MSTPGEGTSEGSLEPSSPAPVDGELADDTATEPSGSSGPPTASLSSFRSQFSGPLPPPSILVGYENVQPGAADRIIAMAERQLDHRHRLETRALEGQIRSEHTGVWLGFTVAVAFLIGSVLLIMAGHTVEGTILGTVDLVALAGIFVYGRSRQEHDLADKRTDQPPEEAG